MSNMTTLSQVLNILKDEGYTTDFNLRENCLICHGNSLELHPEDFVVDRHYRFEGDTDPGDSAIVYAISSEKHGVKGVMVNGYGLYSDPMSDAMMKALEDKSSNPENQHSYPKTVVSPLSAVNLDDAMAKLNSDLSKDVNTTLLDKSPGMTLMLIALNQGAELKTHTAPGPISVHVLQGSISFRTESATKNVEAGSLITLAAELPHSVVANARSLFLVTVHTPMK